ncbi:MAG TPA: sodium-dependent transporter [Longimicrobiales bacterium]|nr:sodium-dependent transporter [Longimicrobiales bacterium]
MNSHHTKEEWGTKLGLILAVAGSAVGLGNFLRFPGQAAANGGGAFLIPYFTALLLVGIPIGWAEWAMGRYAGKKGMHSAPAIMGLIGKGSLARYFGVIGVLIPLGVSFYYVFIEAWTFGYFLKYITGGIGVSASAPIAEQSAAAGEFYNNFTGSSADGVLFTGDSKLTIISWIIVFAINIYLVFRGISKGIEKFVSWAMPAMAVLALLVLIRVLTLGTPDPAVPDQNVVNGLGYMWNPNYSKLADFQTWLAAAGQIFFSLSVGFGIILNYASYMKPKDDVALSSLTASATNELFEVGFGGMITIPAAFIFLGLTGTAAAVATGTFGLGFNTLPVVFAHMGPLGNFVGAAWFFMLFLAAITSSISMYQPAVALMKEALGWSHKKATASIAALGTIGALLTLWFTQGGAFWSTVDFWVGTFLIFVMATLQIILFSWVFGIDRGWKEIHDGASIRIPPVFKFIMKYVAPIYLLIVFIGFCAQNLGPSIQAAWASTGSRMGVLMILATLLLLLVVAFLGERRWRAAGIDIDDKSPVLD